MNSDAEIGAEGRLAGFLRHLLDTGPFPGKAALAYRTAVSVCAVAGTAVPVTATVKEFALAHGPAASTLELVAVLGLAVDLVLQCLRVWLTAEGDGWKRLRKLTRYLTSPFGIIDLLAVVPYLVTKVWMLPADLYTVLGLIRFIKLARFSPALETLESVLRREIKPLRAALFLMMLLMLVSATVLYIVERDVNPDGFGSIPQALWWAVITLSTLGYGDAVPITPLGKVLGGVVALTGIGMFALPASILANGFSEEVKRRDFLHTWHMVAKVPFLSELNADQIAAIVGLLRYVPAAPGDVLIRRGDMGDRMYFIVSGTVGVELGNGRASLLEDGNFFGEIALLHSTQRTATVAARTRCQLLALDAKNFRHFLSHSPTVAKIIANTARQRLNEQAEFAEIAGGADPRRDIDTES